MTLTSDTFTYKRIGDLEIRADVYGGSGPKGRPVIVWLHPGALMFGDRRMIQPDQLERYLGAGYAVVAVDYRLAPETRVPEILADVQDAIAWVRTEGPGRFGIDPTRLALVGHSAGGYLTLMAGCTVVPRPQALVAFYGYGDIAGSWYSAPSPHYCQFPLVSEAEARAVVGQTPLSGSSGEPVRGRFYLYCRQRGLWPLMVTGHDPAEDLARLLPYCPVRQVSADFPPTLLLHGTADTDVPYEQSLLMESALEAARVPHEFITIPGGEHMFDRRHTDPKVAAACTSVLAFLDRHL